MSANNAKNRLSRFQQFAHAAELAVDRVTAEWQKFSEAGHVLVQKAFPQADFRFTRGYAAASPMADEADPNATAPSIGDWDTEGFAGLSGYLKFTAGTNPTADVELWCKDVENQNWFLVAKQTAVGGLEEFRFEDKARGRKCFLRITNITTGVTSVDMFVSGE